MKNILFLFVLFTSCTFAQVQDYNLRIGSGKDPDSTYCLLTATTGSNFAGRGQFKSLPQLATLLQPFLSGGGGTWGSITGTLSNQTDLQNALNAKLSSETQGINQVLDNGYTLNSVRNIELQNNSFSFNNTGNSLIYLDGSPLEIIIGGQNANQALLNIYGNTANWTNPNTLDATFGINQPSPSEALDVTGNGLFSGTLNASNLSGTNTGDQDLSGYLTSEVDGSVSNELQTITNSSDATSHTVTLSNSGGSTQFIEGSGITLTTGGTGSAGTVTIAASGGASYLVYTANLDFGGGGDPPTPIVLENTLGGTVVFAYEGTGTYSGTLAGMFPDETKVWFSLHLGSKVETNKASVYTDGSDVFYIENFNNSSAFTDASSSAFYHLEIRVYP